MTLSVHSSTPKPLTADDLQALARRVGAPSDPMEWTVVELGRIAELAGCRPDALPIF